MIIAPSLLAADFTNLKKEIENLNASKAKWLHLDIMDGQFVENISYGHELIKQIRPLTKLYFDVHVMIKTPILQVEKMKNAGAESYTFHIEELSSEEISKTIDEIKKFKMKIGIAIKPETIIQEIIPYINELDLILIMSVEPGRGGQSFMPQVLSKVEYLVNYRKDKALNYQISIDGGINNKTLKQAKEAGIDVAVAGSYLFKDNLAKKIQGLLDE